MLKLSMPQTIKNLLSGSRAEKKHAFYSLAMWFAAGGFLFSAFENFFDKIIPGDMDSPMLAILAGIIAAVISTIKATA